MESKSQKLIELDLGIPMKPFPTRSLLTEVSKISVAAPIIK
jgi:hypothetical protein